MNSLNRFSRSMPFLLCATMLLLLYGYADAGRGGWGYGGVNPDSPVIERVLAADNISPGTTWRVYLWASDPNGDISFITYVVERPGAADYSPGHLRVKTTGDGKLQGYLYLNTVSVANSTSWEMWFTVKITVEDSRGNRSLPKVFKVYFGDNRQDEVRSWEKARLASMGLEQPSRIGRMHIELVPIGDAVGAAGVSFIPGGP